MKVIMVTNVISPDKLGGLERYVRELSAGLVKAGHRVIVISKRVSAAQAAQEVGSDGVEVIRISAPSKRNPFFALVYPFTISKAVRHAIRSIEGAAEDVPVLHGHFPVPMIGASLRRTPYVYTCHAPVYKEILDERQGSYMLPRPIQKLAVWGLKVAERHVISRARAVITLSQFIRGEVRTLDKRTGDRVKVIPGGLNTERFSPYSPTTTRPSGGPILFAARRLVKRTGAEELVAAMPRILESLPGARLFLAGDGSRRDYVVSEIALNGVEEQVTLLGHISEEKLLSWYREADIAVTPTQDLEGFGLSTVEALSCGTPALVTPVGANAEVVGSLSSLLVSREKTPLAIADAVVGLWSDQEAYGRIRELARGHVHPEMSWSVVVDEHVKVYEGIIRTRSMVRA